MLFEKVLHDILSSINTLVKFNDVSSFYYLCVSLSVFGYPSHYYGSDIVEIIDRETEEKYDAGDLEEDLLKDVINDCKEVIDMLKYRF